ncbi:hypothetical protein [Mesorhizobium sp. J428]|uniref:hypothetical protein n=1 Tax=Mesorhizobium sp. J428 TaxID=2898440 RepID=UPI002150CFE8|nr:hypothetical protein [Mesorhizobium sp. J428]MCR5857199.1 hypothetical protein [Mesorhizobium sp. J428]
MPTAIFTRALRAVEAGDSASTAVLLDSASSIGPQDEGKFVVTGSHGGLPGNSATRAIKAAVRLVIFNDAGIGKDDAGTRRLPALERLGIAGLCVSAASARIGEAASTYETGIVSVCNALAGELGIQPGDWIKDLHARLARAGSTA